MSKLWNGKIRVIEVYRKSDNRRIATFLADNGVSLVLTGHMHIQSINEFTTQKGNKLYDVCTATTVGTPGKYRKIEITETGKMDL